MIELNLIIIGLGKVSTDVVFQQVLGKGRLTGLFFSWNGSDFYKKIIFH